MKYWRSRNVPLFVTLLMPFFITTGITIGLATVTAPAMALTNTFYVTGQDIDLLMENDETYVVKEIEYNLRKIPFFREVKDFIFDVTDNYMAEE